MWRNQSSEQSPNIRKAARRRFHYFFVFSPPPSVFSLSAYFVRIPRSAFTIHHSTLGSPQFALRVLCECDHETNNHISESLFDRIIRFAVEGSGHGCRPRGLAGKHDRVPETISRNEGEPHPMSSESTTTGEPNRFTDGEGCQDQAGQSRKDIGPQSLRSDQRTGGVGGGGGSRKVFGLSSAQPAEAMVVAEI